MGWWRSRSDSEIRDLVRVPSHWHACDGFSVPCASSIGFVAVMTLKVAIGPQKRICPAPGIRRARAGHCGAVPGSPDETIAAGVGGFAAAVHAHPNAALICPIWRRSVLDWLRAVAARNAWRPSGLVAVGIGAGCADRHEMQMCLVVTFLNPHVYLDAWC